ncbi:MAG: UDP-N-acetylmuramate--L-alanine ligase [Clostridia bacterium]|nr:UDP-N-acetylmuramate--L-alanine ligase [Clostridia bacterium]
MALDNTNFGAQFIAKLLDGKKKLFFCGIGGVSMCSLAHISRLRGHEVSGYDRTSTPATEALEELGITVYYEEDASHIDGIDALIYTVAIPETNPEYSTAKARGIPCISRADFLGYLMYGYGARIGISGMHGKSTTTSMAGLVFTEAGLDPTVSCGAVMKDVGGYHRIGGEDFFVFEACEYMDSFLSFYPTLAVVLNIEMDHVDYFKSMQQIHDSYRSFINRTDGGIALVNCADDDVMKASQGFEGRLITFGVECDGAEYRADDITFVHGCGHFNIYHFTDLLCHVELSVPGAHCICDALAAAAACHICGGEGEAIARGLNKFRGAGRRMDRAEKDALCGAAVFSDYAHHPTEIAVTLSAASQMEYDRVFCVFQPHTYSRTSELFEDFASALAADGAYEIIIAPIYSARETNTYGVSGEALSDRIDALGANARFIAQFSDIADYLNENATKNDMIIIMGAGDITKVIPYLTK